MTKFIPSAFSLLALISGACIGNAAEPGGEVDLTHAPMIVNSKPVIARVPLDVINPVDVIVNSLDETLVADQAGKVLFRVDGDGEASVPGQDLAGIIRVVDSPGLGIHVLLSKAGGGRVVRILDTGQQSGELAYVPFTPTGLGIDAEGNLLTANGPTGEVFKTEPHGRPKRLIRLGEPITDLVIDKDGNTIVLLSSGELVAVFSDGTKSNLGYVPPSATRVRMHPKNFVVALAENERGEPILATQTMEPDHIERFASVPRGTTSFAFDKLGNLTLANRYIRAVTQVTSHFLVRCSHCGKLVPMEFSQQAKPRRSF